MVFMAETELVLRTIRTQSYAQLGRISVFMCLIKQVPGY